MNRVSFKLDNFNDCEGERVKKLLDESKLAYEIVDIEADYWQNDGATLVLHIKEDTFQAGLKLGQLAVDLSADELNGKKVEGNNIVRMWWD